MGTNNPADNLFEQMATITKAYAYDIMKENAEYWEKRCRLAEKIITATPIDPNDLQDDLLAEWRAVKEQEFKRLLPK